MYVFRSASKGISAKSLLWWQQDVLCRVEGDGMRAFLTHCPVLHWRTTAGCTVTVCHHCWHEAPFLLKEGLSGITWVVSGCHRGDPTVFSVGRVISRSARNRAVKAGDGLFGVLGSTTVRSQAVCVMHRHVVVPSAVFIVEFSRMVIARLCPVSS